MFERKMEVLLGDFYILCKALRMLLYSYAIRNLTIQWTWRTRRSHIKKLQSSENLSTTHIKLDKSIKMRQHCLVSLISETKSLNPDTCFGPGDNGTIPISIQDQTPDLLSQKRIYPSSFFPKTRAPSWYCVCLIFKIKENKKRYKYRRIAPFMCLFTLKVT